MNRDDIFRMAREAGLNMGTIQQYERFAALVAAAEREKLIFSDERLLKSIGFQLEVDKFVKAIEAEREACAKLVDECVNIELLADAIRARGQG